MYFFSFTDVPFPPSNKLITSEVFDPRTNKPRTDVLKQHFIVEGKIFFITFSMIRYFGPEIKSLLYIPRYIFRVKKSRDCFAVLYPL